jgi:hypothetical protein
MLQLEKHWQHFYRSFTSAIVRYLHPVRKMNANGEVMTIVPQSKSLHGPKLCFFTPSPGTEDYIQYLPMPDLNLTFYT